MSKADRDMYNLNLHEEEACRVFDDMWNSDDEEPEDNSGGVSEGEKAVYLAKVETAPEGTFAALWDSGATNTVIGRGPQARLILDGYTVIHDDAENGWIDPKYLQQKEHNLKERAKRRIIVASGEAVTGYSVDTLDLGMKASTLINGKWSKPDRNVFLTVKEASVAPSIPTTVFSEGHFMKQNPDWTLITKGTEKFLVYADIKIHYGGIGDELPLRIDLRDSKGGHYLDVTTAVTDTDKIRVKGDIIVDDKGPTVRHHSSQDPQVRMMRVESMSSETEPDVPCTHDVTTNTEETVSYMEPAQRRHFKSLSAEREVVVEREFNASQYETDEADVYQRMREAQDITEDPYSSSTSRVEAMTKFEQCIAELQRYANFMRHRKADAVRVMAMETRRKKATVVDKLVNEEIFETDCPSQAESVSEAQESHEEISPAPQQAVKDVDCTANQGEEIALSAYEEYDKHHKSSVDIKKRVKFQDQIDSDKIFERAAVHADLRQAEERKKEKKAKKKEQRQDQDGGAAAEAKRRRDLQYEKEKTDMSDISHFDKYTSETTTGVTVCREDTYARQETIDNASDFALAMFLMENNVKL
jgi:hypothetical protein